MVQQEEIYLEDTERFLSNNDDSTKFSSDDKKVAFSGLSKEEIMKYGDDPQWVKIRWFLFILFWIVWVTMLASAILIIIWSPKCGFVPSQFWYEKEVVYQLDVATFKDSSDDGVGDLNGLNQKLSYFNQIGIRSVNLRENLLEENNPKQIKSVYGTESSLTMLKKSADSNDIHLILDIPYSSLLPKAEEVLSYWLTNFVDGVRVTGLADSSVSYSNLTTWFKVANDISKKTFKPKLLSFYPPIKVDDNLQSTLNIDQTLLNLSHDELENKNEFIKKLSQIKTNSFILNDFNSKRIKESINSDDLLHLYHSLALLLKGTPFVLYGDELEFGKSDKYMKWEPSNACGFSLNQNIKTDCSMSAKEAVAHGSGLTLVNLYKDLIKLRQEPSFNWGKLILNENATENVISYIRKADGFAGYLVAANTDPKNSYLVDFKQRYDSLLPEEAQIEYFFSTLKPNNDFKLNSTVSTRNIKLRRGEFLVLKFN